jgi:hypothetical protein
VNQIVCLTLGDIFSNEGIYIPTLIAASIIAVIAIRTVGSVLRSNSKERTRREIAAYIAEGSMSPEQGERLMKAGKD